MLEFLLSLFYGYLLIGAMFGLYFVGWGAAQIDHDAEALSWPMRLILWPGSVALWPVLALKLVQHRQQKP